MNRQKLLENLKQNFMFKRLRAQEECEEFISNLRQNKEFDDLYLQYSKKQLEYCKAELDSQVIKLKQDILELKSKIDDYLRKNNIDKSKFEPKYECEICNDTGVAGGRICKCLTNALNQKLTKEFCSQTTFKTFSDSDDNITTEEEKKIIEWLKLWCNKYPLTTKTNINIMGAAGCGKTFLLECVASELINKNAVVCYKTAFELNELARLYHCGSSYEFNDCINADVLLIDDLGTEPILKNVTKEYLYNLINTRQINKRPTFISTNLSLEHILDRYDERIFSRLGNKNLSVNILLNSSDKRMK